MGIWASGSRGDVGTPSSRGRPLGAVSYGSGLRWRAIPGSAAVASNVALMAAGVRAGGRGCTAGDSDTAGVTARDTAGDAARDTAGEGREVRKPAARGPGGGVEPGVSRKGARATGDWRLRPRRGGVRAWAGAGAGAGARSLAGERSLLDAAACSTRGRRAQRRAGSELSR